MIFECVKITCLVQMMEHNLSRFEDGVSLISVKPLKLMSSKL